MTEVTVQDLSQRGAELVARAAGGEKIAIVRAGTVVARLVAPAVAGKAGRPRKQTKAKRVARRQSGRVPRKVDWTKSAAFTLDHTGSRVLSHEEVMELLGRTPPASR